jgi:transcriptional regulator with XRE-family HTH domain
MLVSELGKTIRNRREVLKITQRHLADLAGISVNTLSKIERGEINPTLTLTEKILDTIGLEITISPKRLQ